MGSPRTYKPRHLRTNESFRPKTINLQRDRDQQLHKTAEWNSFRKRFLSVNPECYCCGDRALVVDHIEPSKGRKDVFERTANHIPMCVICHNTVTGKFDYKFSPGESLAPKLNFIAGKRATNELLKDRKFPRVKPLRYRE